MKYGLLLLVIFSPLTSEEFKEKEPIQLLIKAQEKSLENLKSIESLYKKFQAQEALCIKAPEDYDALFLLSKDAYFLRKAIQEASIEPYFRPVFLEELERIMKPYESKIIPPISP
jgi:hypothetical protein